jgi:mRNA-degrading endonuclease toxin of MazEF toxin-antitoxin module
MTRFELGDIIKISDYKNRRFVIVSKNAFIRAAGVFHVVPLWNNIDEGPLHIHINGKKDESGIVLCEQIKLIDPSVRNCYKLDSLVYEDIMNVSDAIQGIFEYD